MPGSSLTCWLGTDCLRLAYCSYDEQVGQLLAWHLPHLVGLWIPELAQAFSRVSSTLECALSPVLQLSQNLSWHFLTLPGTSCMLFLFFFFLQTTIKTSTSTLWTCRTMIINWCAFCEKTLLVSRVTAVLSGSLSKITCLEMTWHRLARDFWSVIWRLLWHCLESFGALGTRINDTGCPSLGR